MVNGYRRWMIDESYFRLSCEMKDVGEILESFRTSTCCSDKAIEMCFLKMDMHARK